MSLLLIRCKGTRSVHTGDTLMFALCALDLVVSVGSVPTLIKLFYVDDGIKYLDHVSCVMLQSFLVAHDLVFSLKTVLLSLLAFQWFILVSFPLRANIYCFKHDYGLS